MSTIDKHKGACVLCKLSTCDGTIAKCLDKDSRHYCLAVIHSCVDNYHQNCTAKQIETDGQNHVRFASWH